MLICMYILIDHDSWFVTYEWSSRMVHINILYTYIHVHIQLIVRTVGQNKKRNTINSVTNYHREMKLVPIIMDYRLFQIDCLKFFLGVHLHRGSLPNFNFFNVNPQFFNEVVKFTSQIAWKQIFTTFLTLV